MKKRYVVILIIIIILGIYAASAMTSGSNNNDNNTSEIINVTTNDNFTWYNIDSSVQGAAGYTISVDVGNESYYFDITGDNKMCDYSPLYNQMFTYDPTTNVDVVNMLGITQYRIEGPNTAPDSFSVAVDKPFSFTYTGGHQVGVNDNAKEVEKIYDSNGNEL